MVILSYPLSCKTAPFLLGLGSQPTTNVEEEKIYQLFLWQKNICGHFLVVTFVVGLELGALRLS